MKLIMDNLFRPIFSNGFYYLLLPAAMYTKSCKLSTPRYSLPRNFEIHESKKVIRDNVRGSNQKFEIRDGGYKSEIPKTRYTYVNKIVVAVNFQRQCVSVL